MTTRLCAHDSQRLSDDVCLAIPLSSCACKISRGPRLAARLIPPGSLSGQLSGQDAERLRPRTSTQQPINHLFLCRLFREPLRTIGRTGGLIHGLEPFLDPRVSVMVNE